MDKLGLKVDLTPMQRKTFAMDKLIYLTTPNNHTIGITYELYEAAVFDPRPTTIKYIQNLIKRVGG